MKVVAIHQPPYFPWIGLLDKIARADVFVVLDTVQFNKRAFQHRTLYSTREGARYLSLSVDSKGHQTDNRAIRDITLVGDGRAPKHLETLRHRYGKSPGWDHVHDELVAALTVPPRFLIDLNMRLLRLSLAIFGLEPAILLASDLEGSGRKGDLMLSLTCACGGSVYLTGSGADAYLDHEPFERAGIGVVRQNFEHPSWNQGLEAPFAPGCFALEWFLENPTSARRDFHAHLARTGSSPARAVAPFNEEGRNR